MKIFKLVAFTGLIVTLISAYLPWVSFNIPTIGIYGFSIPDLVRILGNNLDQSLQIPSQIYSQLALLFSTPIFMAGLSLAFLIASVLFGTAGMAKRKTNAIAGVSEILSCILWIEAIQLLKSEIVKHTGFLGSIIYPLVEPGIGPALAAFAGFIFLIAFALNGK